MSVVVRPLGAADVGTTAKMHRVELGTEFLSRFGDHFMRSYYRAWISSPGSIALVATEGDELVGVLLGSTEPAQHVHYMVRRYGLRIAFELVAYASVHPTLARELVVTRLKRYVGGLVRLLRRRLRSRASPSLEVGVARTGEVTHVFVRASRQGEGIGRSLLASSEEVARRAGVTTLSLVTPPDQGARQFYERLEWINDGEMTSRSGEAFVRFHRDVAVGDGPDGDVD